LKNQFTGNKMTPTTIVDIIIIGGGIIGNSIAAYLSRKTEVTILVAEQNMLCSGSTSLAGSLITRLREKTNLIPLISETFSMVSEIRNTLNFNIGENKTGSLHISTDHPPVLNTIDLQQIAQKFDIDTYDVDKNFIEKNVPWIKTEKVRQALFVPDDFYVDGIKLGLAYARMARQNGVQYRTNEAVSEILITNEKVVGVKLNGENVYAPVVIDAAGIWSNRLLEKHNVSVPAAPVRSIYFLTKVKPGFFPEKHPICIMPDVKAFSRPSNGALLFGIRDSKSSFTHPRNLPHHISDRKYIHADEMWHVLKNEAQEFCQLIKKTEEIEIAHWVAAPCSYSFDGNPVIGKISGIGGLYAATGCNGAGIAVSAGLGRLVAEIVLGEKTFIPIDEFSPSRFSGDVYADEFMQLCSAQRSQKKSG